MKRALIAGATGLVGGFCLAELLASEWYVSVTALGRRLIKRQHPKLAARVVDFTALAGAEPVLADHAFCCLGTTLRQAGSRAAFRAVDFDAVLAFARFARRSGATRLAVVSSLGADRHSRVFYSDVKGEAEAALAGVEFEHLVILRPSLLLGPRREVRVRERMAAALAAVVRPVFAGRLRRYRPVHAQIVARVMVAALGQEGQGIRILESEEIAAAGGAA